jgi:hypothetical protein
MKTREYEKFDQTMRELVKVPHSEIEAKFEAEKATEKRKKSKDSSAPCA